MPNIIRVGVIHGGKSNESDISNMTGKSVFSALERHPDNKYEPVDVFIDKTGIWQINGIASYPESLAGNIDVAFNALHGSYGEDGKIQSYLETHGIPFTGSGSLASSIGFNKSLTKTILKKHGIKSPHGMEVQRETFINERDSLLKELFHTLILPVIIKPTNSGSSIGVSKVSKYSELEGSFNNAFLHSNKVIIEEFIDGIETSCGVIEEFRGQKQYALPAVEIRHAKLFYDFEAKYSGLSKEIIPATFSYEIKQSIEKLSRDIHSILGLRQYSRTDFIIHPKRGIFVLEVNTLPGLFNDSLLLKSLESVGSGLTEFVDHIVIQTIG